MLKVSSVNFDYGVVPVLRNVSLEVKEGEIVALLGANGAGKTTLMRVISGLLRPQSGTIYFQGQPITGLPPHEICRRGLFHVPEGRKLFLKMKVKDNLMVGAMAGASRRQIQEKMAYVFELFPILAERANQIAGTLSGGEQQQLAIGRALMGGPRLLLLDEPTLGLSPVMAETVLKTVSDLNNKTGLTILIVSQEVVGALNISARAYVLENGVISIEGTSADLLNDERVRVTYLGL